MSHWLPSVCDDYVLPFGGLVDVLREVRSEFSHTNYHVVTLWRLCDRITHLTVVGMGTLALAVRIFHQRLGKTDITKIGKAVRASRELPVAWWDPSTP